MVAPHKTWEHHDDGSITATVYEQPSCITAPVLGCQRVKLSVLRTPNRPITCAGKLDGDQLTKFEGSLTCGIGSLEDTETQEEMGGKLSRFFLTIQRAICMLGIWLGLYAAVRPLGRLLRFAPPLAKWGSFKLSGIVATFVGTITYLLHIGGVVFALVMVVALLVASREPASTHVG
jgi:hypothetical protein